MGGDTDANVTSSGEAERAVVTDCRPVPNVADEPQFRYELDPAATVDAIESLESDGLDHVGFYHTHPRGPRGPSRTDQAQATWSGYVYLIVSLADEPVIGAWRWTGESFVHLPIDVDDD
jgi:proteasome lid subunit RPN8/RPN11